MARKYKRDKNGRFASGSGLSDRLARYDTYKRVAGYAGAAAGLAAAGYVGHKALTSRQIKVSELGQRPVRSSLTGRMEPRGLPPVAKTKNFKPVGRHSQRDFDAMFGPNRVRVGTTDVHQLLGVPEHVRITQLKATDTTSGEGLGVKCTLRDASGKMLGKMERSFTRDGDKIIAHHDSLKLAASVRQTGIARSILRGQVEAYDRLGISEIRATAMWDGRYVWPKMGFQASTPRQMESIQKKFKAFSGADVTSMTDLVAHPKGKAFLLSDKVGGFDVKVDLRGKSGDAFRASLRKKK